MTTLFSLSKTVSLVQAYRMFNNLSNTGEYRVNGDLGISFKLTRWLNWNTSLSDRFLSNPVAGRKRNDFLYTRGVGRNVRAVGRSRRRGTS